MEGWTTLRLRSAAPSPEKCLGRMSTGRPEGMPQCNTPCSPPAFHNLSIMRRSEKNARRTMRMKTATSAKRASASPTSETRSAVVSVLAEPSPNGQPVSEEATTEALPMVREWLIGGCRYGPNGQNLGPVSSAWYSRQAEPDTGPFVNQDESALFLVVEGSLATANGSGLPVRLWGCRMRIAYESVTVLEMATLHSTDVVLFDLVLSGRAGFDMARRLRTKAGFRKADLIAMRSNEPEAALFRTQEPDFDLHLVKTVNRAELRELLAAVESSSASMTSRA
jgi:CheY-like chemotaxis protein